MNNAFLGDGHGWRGENRVATTIPYIYEHMENVSPPPAISYRFRCRERAFHSFNNARGSKFIMRLAVQCVRAPFDKLLRFVKYSFPSVIFP